ncbi:sulfotransferase family 2 domain-containing protein [Sinirhodobacter sp. HNIBRBA609]|nr:sulfotransferase family 2 domain-containing protein [Sinirhodobacter sp. HNIBRBA609]
MPAFALPGARILFIQIPKTGGMAMDAAFNAFGAMKLDEVANPEQRNRMRHLHAAEIDALFDLSHFDYVFAVVRNPIERMLSEYRYQCRKPGLHLAPALGFDHWLQYSLFRRSLDKGYRDNHFRPQSEFIVPGCEIFRYEEGLERPLARIKEMTGHDLSSGLSVRNISPRRDVVPSPASLARIARAYSSDFDAFGYSMDY